MGARFRLWWQKKPKRSWWQQIKKHPVASVLIALLVTLVVLVILGGYKFDWGWTGFNQPSKTLWDWLQLLGVLAVPVVVGFGAVWFTTRQGKVADAENKDNQRETALQAYINQISELLLHENLRESKPEHEVRKIARVRTLTVISRLDAYRKCSILQFLYESGLIDKDKTIIDLNGADLSKANLRDANLNGANLSDTNLKDADLDFASLNGAVLTDADLTNAKLRVAALISANFHCAHLNGASLIAANLTHADLSGANLTDAYIGAANLSKANLYHTNLSGAFLDGANLREAYLDISYEQLEKRAKSLKGATMPDGKIHP